MEANINNERSGRATPSPLPVSFAQADDGKPPFRSPFHFDDEDIDSHGRTRL